MKCAKAYFFPLLISLHQEDPLLSGPILELVPEQKCQIFLGTDPKNVCDCVKVIVCHDVMMQNFCQLERDCFRPITAQ